MHNEASHNVKKRKCALATFQLLLRPLWREEHYILLQLFEFYESNQKTIYC